jgi:hypothetical protein
VPRREDTHQVSVTFSREEVLACLAFSHADPGALRGCPIELPKSAVGAVKLRMDEQGTLTVSWWHSGQ